LDGVEPRWKKNPLELTALTQNKIFVGFDNADAK
jgi:hypothetical protein